jgi:hypothetical protein
LPAVQAAREAARRSQCGNQLKQLGLALHNYADVQQRFPPSGIHNAGGIGSRADSTSWGPSWIVMSLPFFEQGPLHAQYDAKIPRSRDLPNLNVVMVNLPTLKCPSDGGEKLPQTNSNARFARGNYASNNGSGNAFSTTDFGLREERGPFHMGGFYGARFADLEDGTSNVILVAEIVAGERANDIRGAWAYPSGSFICGGMPSYASPRIRIPPNGNALDDNLRDRPGRCDASNTDRYLRCLAEGNRAYQTARSKHPGGVQVCLGDASVRMVNSTIPLNTWLSLLSQADGAVVSNY